MLSIVPPVAPCRILLSSSLSVLTEGAGRVHVDTKLPTEDDKWLKMQRLCEKTWWSLSQLPEFTCALILT